MANWSEDFRAGHVTRHFLGDSAVAGIYGISQMRLSANAEVRPITLQLTSGSTTADLFVEDQEIPLQIKQGVWSDWLRVKFKTGLMQTVSGFVRFYLRQIEPVFEFYASPINFDPEAPLYPISAPAEYSRELYARLGGYYTLGMAEDHDGLINGRFDKSVYLQQCDLVIRDRRRMMLSELDRFKEGFLFCLYDTPDRLAHMFWRFREPGHPANQNNPVDDHQLVIEDHYRVLDNKRAGALRGRSL